MNPEGFIAEALEGIEDRKLEARLRGKLRQGKKRDR